MPELPEVEIVRQSLDKKIRQKKVKKVIIRNKNLRIKIPNTFKKVLENKTSLKVSRFSKYVLPNICTLGCNTENRIFEDHLGPLVADTRDPLDFISEEKIKIGSVESLRNTFLSYL